MIVSCDALYMQIAEENYTFKVANKLQIIKENL